MGYVRLRLKYRCNASSASVPTTGMARGLGGRSDAVKASEETGSLARVVPARLTGPYAAFQRATDEVGPLWRGRGRSREGRAALLLPVPPSSLRGLLFALRLPQQATRTTTASRARSHGLARPLLLLDPSHQ